MTDLYLEQLLDRPSYSKIGNSFHPIKNRDNPACTRSGTKTQPKSDNHSDMIRVVRELSHPIFDVLNVSSTGLIERYIGPFKRGSMIGTNPFMRIQG